MFQIKSIKQNVQELEKKQDWMAICLYLQMQYKNHPDSPDLCVLLMQQSMDYFLACDNGFSSELSMHNNHSVESTYFYRNCFVKTMKQGMERHMEHKYFLWQLCFYLFHASTYYLVFDVLENEVKIQTKWKELMAFIKEQYPDSLIFKPFILEIDDFSWIHSLSDGERSSLQSEIAEWHLCENNSDKDVKALFMM